MPSEHRFTVAVAHHSIGDETYVRELIGDRAEVRYGPLTTNDEAAALTEGADAVVVTLQALHRERLGAIAPSVKVIGRGGVGLDNIDLEAAAERRLAVVHEPTYATAEVANQASALLLAATRRVVEANAVMQDGGWGLQNIGLVPDLSAQTLGVVGFGAIGRAFATRMKPFFGETVVFDPQVSESEITAWGARPVATLHELLAASDAVSLHIPLLPATRGIIGAAEFAIMKPGSVIVNVSRGGLIDEASLVAALTSGHLGGAGIDVFEQEPPPENNPLRGVPGLIITPHMAWYSDGASDRMSSWTVDDVFSVLEGRAPGHGRLAVGSDWLNL